MAMTESKLAYHKKWREANKEKVRASYQKWYERNGKERYQANLELRQAIARKHYHKKFGSPSTADQEQEIIDQIRAVKPKSPSGAKARLTPEENRDRRKASNRKVRYRHIEGVASMDLSQLVSPGKCEICGGGTKICLDHCHATNRLRGWICDDCNLAIGRAKEDPILLRAMADYLEKFKGERLGRTA